MTIFVSFVFLSVFVSMVFFPVFVSFVFVSFVFLSFVFVSFVFVSFVFVSFVFVSGAGSVFYLASQRGLPPPAHQISCARFMQPVVGCAVLLFNQWFVAGFHILNPKSRMSASDHWLVHIISCARFLQPVVPSATCHRRFSFL